MASDVSHPENVMAWFIRGNHLAIVTTEGSSSTSTHSKLGDWKAVDSATTDGLLIHYQAEPNSVSAITNTPDVDNTLHSSLVDYVKFRLYQDKAGNSADVNISAISMNLAKTHENKWTESIKRFGSKKRDKVGGDRRIMPPDLR
jgi:hypothetical protein|tara:strand:- start:98 stop:529 length:432 start_codon:yes stop_codon:yes gene_type:complete